MEHTAASSAYNNGYYADPGYAYAPGYVDSGYAYAPDYAYEPGPVDGSYAYGPAPRYRYYGNSWSSQHNTNNFSIDSQR